LPVSSEKIIEELQFLSDRLSSQVRLLSAGLLAFVWGVLLAGDSATPLSIDRGDKGQLLGVGLLALLAMFADLLQYVFGYLFQTSARKRMKAQSKTAGDFVYDYTDWRYRLRIRLFWAKLLILAVAVIWLGVIMVPVAIRLAARPS
jgi:hypothetical protein